jgi:hypothetical protein
LIEALYQNVSSHYSSYPTPSQAVHCSAWFVGALAIMVSLMFATALYLLPPSGTM